MLKKYKFIGLFGRVILRLFPSRVTSCQGTLVFFVLLCITEIRQEVIYYTSLCFKNLFLRRYAYMLCNVSLNTPIACSLVRFPGMNDVITCKSKQIIGRALPGAFSKIS